MIVGELLAFMQFLIGRLIESYALFSNDPFTHSVSSPLAFVYAILAVMAIFYPLGGFLADVYCGQFKTVMIGLGFLTFSFSSLIVVFVWLGIITKFGFHSFKLIEYPLKEVTPVSFIGFGTFCLSAFGIVAFQANSIQLGLDQLMDTPSRGLSIFIHLAVWANDLGTTIMGIGGALLECPTSQITVRIAWNVLPILIVFSIPFLLIITCCKRQ